MSVSGSVLPPARAGETVHSPPSTNVAPRSKRRGKERGVERFIMFFGEVLLARRTRGGRGKHSDAIHEQRMQSG
jgi:hypothetical protein